MKILITGASGFTGFHLAKTLREKGHDVYGFIRNHGKSADLENAGIHVVVGDLTNEASVRSAVKGKDLVYHIAASYREAGVPSSVYHQVNVTGTQYVMQAVKDFDVSRVVHCSTVGVHGHITQPPANEEAPFNPDDAYQTSKLEGEKIVSDMIERGLPGVIFRPVGIFGPGDKRFLKLFKAISKGSFVMFGKGDVLYHLTFIDDLVAGIIACGENPNAIGKTYIIAGGQAVSLNDLVEKISDVLSVKKPGLRLPFGLLWWSSVLCEGLCKPLGLNPPLFRRRADFFRKDRSFDARKIQHELGFEPRINLEEGLRRTAEWYKANNLI